MARATEQQAKANYLKSKQAKNKASANKAFKDNSSTMAMAFAKAKA